MNKSATKQASIDKPLAQLNDYCLLGTSGLHVSPLCLRAMTFSTNWGEWGTGFKESKHIFDYYIEKGSNFIDTANIYTNSTSEQYVGELVVPIHSQMVVATKYSINPPSMPGIPPAPMAKNANYGGNHHKAMVQGLDELLKHMKLDYVNVLYVHMWDHCTPIDETMRALDDVVRSGKALYVTVSNMPTWVISTTNNTAQLWGWRHSSDSPYIGLQTQYNLLNHSLKWELGPMAKAYNISIIPWGSVAEGFLTSKHKKDQLHSKSKRGHFLERHFAEECNWKILDEVLVVAKEINRPAVQVALNWLVQKPGVTSPLMGVHMLDQLKENITALEFTLLPSHMQCLDQVSEQPISKQPFPRTFITMMDATIGRTKVDHRYVL